MTIFIRRVETIYDGMELEEKRELLVRLARKAESDGFLAEARISMAGSGPAKVAKKKGAWKGRKPYWCKTLTSYDGGAKGTDCIVGEYFFDVKDAVDVGGYYVVGFRAEPKSYALMRREDGSNITMEHDGRDHVFEDSECIEKFDSFKKLKVHIATVFMA